MRPPIRLLLAGTLFYYSLCALGWAWNLHAEPWAAADFANEQAASAGFDWPQDSFYDRGMGTYQARYFAPDNSGKYVTVEVRKSESGWELISLTEGLAKWRANVASR